MHSQTIAVDDERRPGINWITDTVMVIFHLGSVAALFTWSWKAAAIAFFFNWVAGGLGIGMGYHRLLTHRGYSVPKFIEYFLTLCGTLALEGGPINWVATHRIHHACSDREGDPHSPRDGRWWSHVGWILVGRAMNHDPEVLERWAPELMNDRIHFLINRYYWAPLTVFGLALLALGGWQLMLWGVFLRVTFGLHSTWLVNSATHIWGKRRFDTRDDSRNNWWVALLAFGEGWHNNHHAHPASARHGLAWYEIDVNWWCIRALQILRLARSVKLARLQDGAICATATVRQPRREFASSGL
ncbi:MAG: fatty acid desaturase [Acidobacteria bacterium]|nr:fatty acid desaturase [Acidobacteriota bacterium]